MFVSSCSPYSYYAAKPRAADARFGGKLSQDKIDKYKKNLGIPDWVQISPENTVSKDSAKRFGAKYATGFFTTVGGELIYPLIPELLNMRAEKKLNKRIKESTESLTGMVTVKFLKEQQARDYVQKKNLSKANNFPFVINASSPTAKNKAVFFITNDKAVAEVIHEAKRPFGADEEEISSDEEQYEESVSDAGFKLPDAMTRLDIDQNQNRTSLSEDDQPEESPFHNAASKLRTSPPSPPKPRRVGTASEVLVKSTPPPVPNPRRVKTASDNDDQPFNSPFHDIQLPGVKRALPPVPVKKEDDEHNPFKD